MIYQVTPPTDDNSLDIEAPHSTAAIRAAIERLGIDGQPRPACSADDPGEIWSVAERAFGKCVRYSFVVT